MTTNTTSATIPAPSRAHPARTWRPTPADIVCCDAVAAALVGAGITSRPTRAAAIRYALRVAAAELRRRGRMPADLGNPASAPRAA